LQGPFGVRIDEAGIGLLSGNLVLVIFVNIPGIAVGAFDPAAVMRD
jgi:hypothetical protein